MCCQLAILLTLGGPLLADGVQGSPSATVPESLRLEQPWQTGPYCGPNCLYFLLKLKGRPVSHAEVVGAFGELQVGASLWDLMRVGEHFAVPLTVVQADERSLARLPTPFVAHLGTAGEGEDGHYVLVCKLGPKTVTLLDGSSLATTNWRLGQFVRSWSGFALIPSNGLRAARYGNLALGACAVGLFLGLVVLVRSSTKRRSLSEEGAAASAGSLQPEKRG